MPPTPTTRLRLADGRSLDLWYDDAPEARDRVPLVFHPAARRARVSGFGPFTDAARRRGLRIVELEPARVRFLDAAAGPARRRTSPPTPRRSWTTSAPSARTSSGHSGGGPHALACAAMLPDRVLGTALIAGVAPWEAEGLDFLEGMGAENHEEFGAALRGEGDLAAYLGPFREEILTLTGPQVAAMFGDLVDDVDRAAMTGEYAAVRRRLRWRRASASRSPAGSTTTSSFTVPWGFDLAAISRPGARLAGRPRSDGAVRARAMARGAPSGTPAPICTPSTAT